MIVIAVSGLVILFGLAILQLSLILGASLGDYAWGGRYKILPGKLRIASSFAIVLYVVFALFLASKAGLSDFIKNTTILNTGMWMFTAYFMLGVLLNACSRSKKERLLMTPIAFILGSIFVFVSLVG